MTPRVTILVLLGDGARVEQEWRQAMTVGYLTALLSQCDPEKAPSLEELLGDVEPNQPAPAHVPEQEDPRGNVLAWVFALGAVEKPPKSEIEEESDG